MTTLTVSLTRAHKIVERLKTHSTQLLADATNAASATAIIGRATGQLERLQAKGKTALDLTKQAERFLRAASAVRAIIGRHNEDRGISAKLAELDAVNKLVAHTRSMVGAAQMGSLELSELADYTTLGKENAYSSLVVNTVEPEDRKQMSATLAALQREVVQLSDAIAEANAARLSFELEDDLAAIATGAA